MNTVSFLFDENLNDDLPACLVRLEPAMETFSVGDELSPPKGTLDPDLLLHAEEYKRILVTLDKRTMVGHVVEHMAQGHHTWGVFILKPGYPWLRYANDLLLIWSASEPEEWRDRIIWLPW